MNLNDDMHGEIKWPPNPHTVSRAARKNIEPEKEWPTHKVIITKFYGKIKFRTSKFEYLFECNTNL